MQERMPWPFSLKIHIAVMYLCYLKSQKHNKAVLRSDKHAARTSEALAAEPPGISL